MRKFEEALEKLKVAVDGGREFFNQSGILPIEYITENVFFGLQNVLKYFIEERHKIEEAENGEENSIIHYTSIGALVSMLQDASKQELKDKERENEKLELSSSSCYPKPSLRMYDSVHLNDPNEGFYFARHLVRHLKQSRKYDWLKKLDMGHAYVASFILPNSKKNMRNNLVFWRTYGDDGEGCSLSITIPRNQLQRVLYGKKKVQETIDDLKLVLDVLSPLLEIENSTTQNNIQEKLSETVWKSLARVSYLYKSKAYEHENECRFVLLEADIENKDNICFEYHNRNKSPARVRHYYEHEDFQIKKLLDSESSITLGPCVPFRSNVRNCIDVLLKRANLYGPEIKCSKIPYRKS